MCTQYTYMCICMCTHVNERDFGSFRGCKEVLLKAHKFLCCFNLLYYNRKCALHCQACIFLHNIPQLEFFSTC